MVNGHYGMPIVLYHTLFRRKNPSMASSTRTTVSFQTSKVLTYWATDERLRVVNVGHLSIAHGCKKMPDGIGIS